VDKDMIILLAGMVYKGFHSCKQTLGTVNSFGHSQY